MHTELLWLPFPWFFFGAHDIIIYTIGGFLAEKPEPYVMISALDIYTALVLRFYAQCGERICLTMTYRVAWREDPYIRK